MTISDFQELAFLTSLPSSMFVQLHTADPGEAGTAAVVPSSTRQSVAFAAPVGGTRATSAPVSWPAWAWGTQTITHISLWSAVTAGNPVWSGPLTTPKVVNDTDTLTFAAGQISVGLD